ncbi:hypothetical protein Natoc_3063 [Natronococcus occultus SP4]|uniref:Glycosyltransferase RgtA/B/C/D-like domain-containing protein n=2 Tax=Natronococcus occultus TaxID=29288 RepID=L0K0K5_9EURY|nr:hypothetical protein Natoc_3063 [Natronococcus occultus SP4]
MIVSTELITERLFPVLPASIALCMGIILVAYYGRDRLVGPLLLAGIVVSVHLLWMAAFGSSMIGTDPDKVALWTQAMIEEESLSGTQEHSTFYAAAPVFLILAAFASLILDTTIRYGFLIYPLLVGFLLPMMTAAVVSRVWRSKDAALVAGILSMTMAQTVMYSFTQIPQNAAVFLWAGFTLAAVLYLAGIVDKNRSLVLLTVFLGAAIHTHKISVLVLFGGVATLLVATFLLMRLPVELKDQNIKPASTMFASVAMVSGLGLVVQWEWITEYTDRAVGRVLAMTTTPSGLEEYEYTTALALNSDVLSIASYSAHLVASLGVAGICWLIIARTDYYREPVIGLLSFCAFIAALTVFSVFGPIANGRILFYAEPLLAIIIGGGIAIKLGPRKSLVVVAIFAFITLQLFVAPATPDYPDTSRSYLTENEVTAKSWGETHGTAGIYTDQRYSRENLPSNIAQHEDPDTYRSLDDEIFEGDLNTSEYNCVAFRDRPQDIHSSEHGTFIWTWDVEGYVANNYGQVHTTGDVNHYCSGP